MNTQYGFPEVATTQTIADKISAHLFRQGKPSMAMLNPQSPSCAYRGTGHTACAVGCIISDEEYSPKFEKKAVGSDVVLENLPKLAPHLGILKAMQEVHDDAAIHSYGGASFDLDRLQSALNLVYQRFGLNTNDLYRYYSSAKSGYK